MAREVTDYLLYRWRYHIGAALIGIALITLLYLIGTAVPGGLSHAEMQSAVVTAQTPLKVVLGGAADFIFNLPYHALQRASLFFFGVSNISIKLPSLILAFASVILLYGLLRLWFRRNVAIITSAIVATTGQFLLHAQLGTPDIGYVFWNIALLFSASMLARVKKSRPLWLLLTAFIAGLSLYTPMQIYIVLALIAICFIHPHARFIVFHQPLWAQISAGMLLIVTALPLILTLIFHSSLLGSWFGIPDPLLAPLSWDNARFLIYQYGAFFDPMSGDTLRPSYGLGIALLALIGLYRLFTAKYTAKSYIITLWMIPVAAAVIFHPELIVFTLVPLVLLVAFAIDFLIRSWYQLFPMNPYARIVGLLPLAVLVVGLSVSGIDQFLYGYHYDPRASVAFSRDVSLLGRNLKKLPSSVKQVTLVADSQDMAFYQLYAAKLPKTTMPSLSVTSPETKPLGWTLYERSVRQFAPASEIPTRIFTGTTKADADRFYLYDLK